ncbi:MAG: SH3 domain-containing protein [Acidobacteria bacterium]|jgi:hypothetical protein|nr:SH3 domain-containing protein [Acidobacteriota bacterium]
MKTLKSTLIFCIFVLFFLSLRTYAATPQVKIIAKQCDIHEQPDAKSNVITQVNIGTILDIKEKSGEWFHVYLPKTYTGNLTTGWIYQNNVEEIKEKKKDRLFLMGIGMVRFNWAKVKGDAIRFRYSDLGLPTDFSTRERASFMIDGTFANQKYNINGHVNYDPENRITEPALEFLLNIGNDKKYLSIGDFQMGVMMDSIFSRYYHPFRGGVLGTRSKRFGVEVLAGIARGESGIEELAAGAGAGPYYVKDSPILRGSEVVYLVTKNAVNPDQELKRTPMVRTRDYFIDYDRGAIIFSYPIYAFDDLGNPVSILVTYQFESLAGRFTRAVYGLRAFVIPVDFLKFNLSYIADSNKNQDLGDIFKNARGILTLGLNIDSKPLTLFGEISFSSEDSSDKQNAFFGGGILNITRKLRLFFNAWSLDENFPTFANNQLQYGYSLFQVFPAYADRNIFLSPFQFTRNLGAELYPFSLSRLSVDETEYHGFLEWEGNDLRVSTGYGSRKELTDNLRTNIFYVSSMYHKEATTAWAKFGIDADRTTGEQNMDSRNNDILLGLRRRIVKFANGAIFAQADFKGDWFKDFLDVNPNTYYRTYSFFAEYLTGSEGFFAGYRKEILTDKTNNNDILDTDVFELGIRRHFWQGLFLDSRYRNERGKRGNSSSTNEIVSLGVGIESKKVRALGRYEFQVNRNQDTEGRRRLWSLYFFGSPVKRMSLSLQYYNQLGKNKTVLPLDEHSEEELNVRFLWRPWDSLNFYAQFRYDTNLEIYPPLDRTRSNSLAEIIGLKYMFSRRMEFLANYKLLKVWGPIENRKYSAAAELGYLLFRHFRVGLGFERIDFQDKVNPAADYKSSIGYFKLVALY